MTEEIDKDLEQVSERHHCPFLFFFFFPLNFLAGILEKKLRNYLGSQIYGMKVFFLMLKDKDLYLISPNIVS